MTVQRIENMQELCNYFHADEPQSLNRRIYKDTACGASISVLYAPEDPDEFGDLRSYEQPSWVHSGDRAWQYMTVGTRILAFTIQTIVEGSDATVDSEPFVLPVETSNVEQWMDYMEQQADTLWQEYNTEYEED